MYSFRNDYAEGAHPCVLEALVQSNLEQTPGYTEDIHCDHARELICSAIQSSDIHQSLDACCLDPRDLSVEFVHGGTMANLLVISAALRPHECVIAAPDGHINVHETGAIEANGHKVITTSDAHGLLSVDGIHDVMKAHELGMNFHMVKPRMIYLSLASEMGLVFTRDYLRDLYTYAQNHGLLIYIDGARIACGLAAQGCDLTLGDICAYSDAFSLGGTKNGALFGEALVIRNKDLAQDFRYIMKQKGAVVAKGRTLGVQYEALFGITGMQAHVAEAYEHEPLFLSLGRHSVAMAMQLKQVLITHGFDSFLCDSPTNQQFLVLDQNDARFFMDTFDADFISQLDDTHTVVRMTCRWSTTPAHIDIVQKVLHERNAS